MTFSTRSPAVVLLSGGLDSTTTLALAIAEGREVHALTIAYGQRHESEVAGARRIAERAGVASHRVVTVDLRAIGGSALTSDVAVPKDRSVDAIGADIPITYVPARNTIFLGIALGLAEVVGAEEIFIGVNALDYSGYPDCRPEFLDAFQQLARVATRAGIAEGRSMRIRAPLIEMTKRDIILLGAQLGVDFALTSSCYDPAPSGAACGRCDACHSRLRGFAEAGIPDPAVYLAAAGAPR